MYEVISVVLYFITAMMVGVIIILCFTDFWILLIIILTGALTSIPLIAFGEPNLIIILL